VLYKGGFFKQVGFPDWGKDAKLDLPNYKCPSAKGFSGYHMVGWRNSKLSGYDYFGTSYSANPLFVGRQGDATCKSNAMYQRPLSRTPNPTNTVMYTESASRFAFFATNTEEYDQTGCQWPFNDGSFTAKGFHKKDFRFNVAFGDGHAAFIKIKGYGLVQIAQQNMPPDCPGGQCRCVLVRGLGWQLDTLPAEPVPVRKEWAGNTRSGISEAAGDANEFAVVNF
jgi:prepilin-type processing-associated H-X9-DG protein